MTFTDPAEKAADEKRLVDLALSLDVESIDLDEVVHDVASQIASDINNGGLYSQIGYLLSELGVAEIEAEIRSAAEAAAEEEVADNDASGHELDLVPQPQDSGAEPVNLADDTSAAAAAVRDLVADITTDANGRWNAYEVAERFSAWLIEHGLSVDEHAAGGGR